MDLLFGLKPCKGYTGVIIFVEAFRLYSVILPVRGKSAKEIVELFRKHIYQAFGCEEIFSDNEAATKSDLFKQFCWNHNIKNSTTAPRSPFQNILAENTVKLVKESIRIYTKQNNIDWVESLSDINICLNKRILTKSKFSPEELLFGNRVNDYSLLQSYDEFTNFDDYLDYFQETIAEMRDKYIEKRMKNANAVRNSSKKSRIDVEIKVSDIVYLQDHEFSQNVGTTSRTVFLGPYLVVEIMQGKKARLLDLVKKTSRIAHIVFLKLSKGPVNMKLGDLSSILQNSKAESTKADAENIEIARKSPRLNL